MDILDVDVDIMAERGSTDFLCRSLINLLSTSVVCLSILLL